MASSTGNSNSDARLDGRLACINRFCKNGEDLSSAMEFVCTYYNVGWKRKKKVCQECLVQCLSHYKQLELKFNNEECVMDSHFPSYDTHMLIESSSSEEDEGEDPIPSTSKCGLPPDKQLETALNMAIDYVINENNDLIDTQLKLCDEYLDKKFNQCMKEADSIDAITIKLENDINLIRNALYDPYKPTTTMLPSDSESESDSDDVEFVEINEDTKIVSSKEKDDKSEKNKNNKLNTNELPKIDKNKKGETDKNIQNKVVMAKENKEEDELDKDVIAINRTVCDVPSDLPKVGILEYPPLEEGQPIFATNLSLLLPWAECVLSSVLNETSVLVRFSTGIKQISIKSVAYFTESPVQFPVGTRVIAKFKNSSKDIESFYAGVIAEPPKLLNKFRYMIFYDDGYVQYQYHKDIRLVVHTSKDICDDLYPDSKEFIRSYLDKYPERQMVRLNNDHNVRVQYENDWILAKVVEIDASLVRLHFTDQNRLEWMYRGSSRLWNIYEKQIQFDRGIRSRQSGLAYLKKPFVEYSSIEEPPRPVKLIARKSSTKSSVAPQHEENKKSTESRNNFSKLSLLSLPINCVKPKKFIPHKCTLDCVEWTDYKYIKTKRINLLAIPLNFGFSRCILNFNSSQKVIIYKTPCGCSIRNLKEMHEYLIKTENKMTIDLFDFNSWVRPLVEYRNFNSKIYSSDMSEGKELKSISLVNTINFNTPPKMDYMTQRQAMPGVDINVENEFLCGCQCTDNCEDKSKCACWKLTIEGQKILPNLDQDPNIGYSYRRLPERVLTGIYECNNTCSCSNKCLNRVVQHPLSQKLQLFLTEKKGWGVRCLNDIPQGSFICIYVGCLLTETDANEGGKNYGDEYLAELDYIEVIEKIKEDFETDVVLSDNDLNENDADTSITNSESSNEDLLPTVKDSNITHRLRKRDASKNTSKTKKDGSKSPSKLNVRDLKINPKLPKSMREYFGDNESVFIMDAKTSGNIGRYLNHSCSPNIFVQNVFVDTHDLRFPWISFFSLHYIAAGTELTWDYSYDIGSVPGKTMKCHCESVYCRGRLL